MSLPVLLWSVAAVGVIAGELWAVFNDESGDTITEQIKRRWWSRGAMVALLCWALWHFMTDEGGWFDLVVLTAGFAFGAFADRMKLRATS